MINKPAPLLPESAGFNNEIQMISSKKNVLFLILSILLMNVQGNDSLKVKSFNSFQTNAMLNHWSESENIAGMIYNRLDNIADFNYLFKSGTGDFHRTMEASDYRTHSIATTSLRKIKKYSLYGGFNYNNGHEEGARWNGTYDPYRGNPYIIGDSVSSVVYRKESYNLTGGIATTLNDRISVGCKVDYLVGVGAKQKDPRPENTVIQMLINPGMIYHKERYNLGIDIGFMHRKEEIDYEQTITDNADISYFAFKGFGFYSKEIGMNYFRFQKQNKLFGGFQYETKKSKIPSLSELKFQIGKEEIEDGSSVVIKERSGDWEIMDFSLKHVIQFEKEKTLRKIVFFANYFNGDGIEYTQQKVYNGSLADYVTIGTNLKFNRKTINGYLQYDYQKFKTEKISDWLFHAQISAINNVETYYYVPEVLSSDYTNLVGNAAIEKNFYSKAVHFTPALSATYCYNLSKNLNLSNVTEITKKQYRETYIRDFNYYSDDQVKLDAQITLGFNYRKTKIINQLFINLNYSYLKSISGETAFSLAAGKIGFVF